MSGNRSQQWLAMAYSRSHILITCTSHFSSTWGKAVRICVTARRVNKFMVPDRATVEPMHQLLQRFSGVNYITSLYISSAFLQIPLAVASRKWTAFQFESKVYRYTRVPYGLKTSLSAFISALHTVLGCESSEYVLNCVDELLILSGTFEDQLRHLDSVLQKLTSAGLTINVHKCNFCKTELSFSGT
jgi:hypothetical protein